MRFGAALLPGDEQELDRHPIRIRESELEAGDVACPGRSEIGDVDEREVDAARRQIDPLRLQARLILRAAVVRHPKVGAVQVIDARHRGLALHDERLDDGRSPGGDRRRWRSESRSRSGRRSTRGSRTTLRRGPAASRARRQRASPLGAPTLRGASAETSSARRKVSAWEPPGRSYGPAAPEFAAGDQWHPGRRGTPAAGRVSTARRPGRGSRRAPRAPRWSGRCPRRPRCPRGA